MDWEYCGSKKCESGQGCICPDVPSIDFSLDLRVLFSRLTPGVMLGWVLAWHLQPDVHKAQPSGDAFLPMQTIESLFLAVQHLVGQEHALFLLLPAHGNHAHFSGCNLRASQVGKQNLTSSLAAAASLSSDKTASWRSSSLSLSVSKLRLKLKSAVSCESCCLRTAISASLLAKACCRLVCSKFDH